MPNEEHGGIPKISRLIFFFLGSNGFSHRWRSIHAGCFFFLEGTMRRSSQEFLNPSQDAIAPDQRFYYYSKDKERAMEPRVEEGFRLTSPAAGRTDHGGSDRRAWRWRSPPPGRPPRGSGPRPVGVGRAGRPCCGVRRTPALQLQGFVLLRLFASAEVLQRRLEQRCFFLGLDWSRPGTEVTAHPRETGRGMLNAFTPGGLKKTNNHHEL